MSVIQGRRKQTLRLTTLLFLLIFCYYSTTFLHQLYTERLKAGVPSLHLNTEDSHLPCWTLPGADSTLVILKTGSTELEAKLPVHLSTTLQCIPHSLLFSDAAEVFRGRTVLDALESVSPSLKDTNPDFELCRTLREHGRAALDQKNGLTSNGTFEESWTGHQENPGWKIDKWKFLPMVNRTYHEYPNMKWYVFMEADTYISWPSLLSHLSGLDPSKPHYSGVQVYIDGVKFAHGGSGFIVSQSAMQLVVEHFRLHQGELEAYTDAHWAGDCVLGKAFADAGVKLQSAWPVMQGDYPGIVPYIKDDGRPMPPIDERIWCNLAVSWHHMEADMVEDLWQFEQELLERRLLGGEVSAQSLSRRKLVFQC